MSLAFECAKKAESGQIPQRTDKIDHCDADLGEPRTATCLSCRPRQATNVTATAQLPTFCSADASHHFSLFFNLSPESSPPPVHALPSSSMPPPAARPKNFGPRVQAPAIFDPHRYLLLGLKLLVSRSSASGFRTLGVQSASMRTPLTSACAARSRSIAQRGHVVVRWFSK